MKADDVAESTATEVKSHNKRHKKRSAPVESQVPQLDGVINTPGVTKSQIEELFGVCWEDIKMFLER